MIEPGTELLLGMRAMVESFRSALAVAVERSQEAVRDAPQLEFNERVAEVLAGLNEIIEAFTCINTELAAALPRLRRTHARATMLMQRARAKA